MVYKRGKYILSWNYQDIRYVCLARHFISFHSYFSYKYDPRQSLWSIHVHAKTEKSKTKEGKQVNKIW